jgi:para-aminobenzoate synthetase component 1
MIKNFLETIPGPVGIVSRPITLDEPFLDVAARFGDQPGTVVLAGGGSDDSARYHLLALWPRLTITAKNGCVTIRTETDIADFQIPPLSAVRKMLSRFHMTDPGLPVPVAAGLFGYLAYDLRDSLEDLPRTSIDDLGLPDMYLVMPRLILVHDNHTDAVLACAPDFPDTDTDRMIDDMEREIRRQIAPKSDYAVGRPAANFTENDYQTAVKKIIEYIAAGDVYQVNLSQRFEAFFSGNPYRLFVDLFRQNPAPFFAYIHAGDHHIVSTSPERFIRQTGRMVETRPIKGTRPRGETSARDLHNREELLASVKDTAELSMIVDLMRNDLGKVCRGGSIRVTDHKRLEAYDNVFHLVSIVAGSLADGKDSADIIEAVFPGGSITGCPKIRSMEIIDELEPCRRHIYTGSIGYIGFHGTMDLSIAIRTAIIREDRIYYSAGGGIVFDSDPADEYRETLAKADTVLKIMAKGATPDRDRSRSWINGRLTTERHVVLPVDAPGFQYGAGLFETIRADDGRPRFLAEHLERFTTSWQVLFATPAPDITWAAVIGQVLKENRLTNGAAAVKIMVALGNRRTAPYDHTLVVTARPYTHRLAAPEKPGLALAVYPHPRLSVTADHKTMNYLYCYLAGQWAAAAGAGEALIMNPGATVSETNTANILLINGRTVTVPESPCVLPGVMQREIIKYLDGRGYEIRQAPVTLDDCWAAEEILLTNSLMGAVPVLSINGRRAGNLGRLWREIDDHLGISIK